MRRHRLGIWWLSLLAVNAAYFGVNATHDKPWLALPCWLAAAFCAVMAYRDLTGIAAYSVRSRGRDPNYRDEWRP